MGLINMYIAIALMRLYNGVYFCQQNTKEEVSQYKTFDNGMKNIQHSVYLVYLKEIIWNFVNMIN